MNHEQMVVTELVKSKIGPSIATMMGICYDAYHTLGMKRLLNFNGFKMLVKTSYFMSPIHLFVYSTEFSQYYQVIIDNYQFNREPTCVEATDPFQLNQYDVDGGLPCKVIRSGSVEELMGVCSTEIAFAEMGWDDIENGTGLELLQPDFLGHSVMVPDGLYVTDMCNLINVRQMIEHLSYFIMKAMVYTSRYPVVSKDRFISDQASMMTSNYWVSMAIQRLCSTLLETEENGMTRSIFASAVINFHHKKLTMMDEMQLDMQGYTGDRKHLCTFSSDDPAEIKFISLTVLLSKI